MKIIISSHIFMSHYSISIDLVENDGLYSIIRSIEFNKEYDSCTKVGFFNLDEIKATYLNIIKEKIVDGSNCKIILYRQDSYRILELRGNDGKYYTTYRNVYTEIEDCNTSCGSYLKSFEVTKDDYLEDIKRFIINGI